MIGKRIIFPKISVTLLNAYLNQKNRDEESRKIRAGFEKRNAMIHVDEAPCKFDETLFLKFILRKYDESRCEYFFFNTYYAECFKGLDIFCFQGSEDPPDLTVFVDKMKQISKQST